MRPAPPPLRRRSRFARYMRLVCEPDQLVRSQARAGQGGYRR
ncbi:MAG: hypothetical protein V9E94_01395 [Microthrixaceae bacterium]